MRPIHRASSYCLSTMKRVLRMKTVISQARQVVALPDNQDKTKQTKMQN